MKARSIQLSYPMNHCLRHFFLLILSLLISIPDNTYADEIRIALRAHKGAQTAIDTWQPTADYLTEKIPEHTFKMVPFENINAHNQAVSQGEFEFILTNPSASVEHRILYGTQQIATLVNNRQGKGYSKFGSVIFTRKDHTDINTLEDLKGKIFIAVSDLGFGGWRVAWHEILKHNINPYTDFKELRFAGGSQPKTVYAVRDGKADAGCVRTDMLERLDADNKININDFKIIGAKQTKDFPFLHSTQLYPEWSFSAYSTVNDTLKTQVIRTLFSIPDNSTAALKGKYIGWISPLDYTPVDELLKDLRVGPYHILRMNSFERMMSQYGLIILITIMIIISLLIVLLYMSSLYRRISLASDSLKNEIITRKSLEVQLIQSQKMESLGKLTGGIAHDFNNMLAIISGLTELSLNTEATNKDDKLKKYLEKIIQTSNKAMTLINQMIAFSRADDDYDKNERISVKTSISEVYQLLRPLLPSNIALVINKCKNEYYINLNQSILSQILMDICLNSKHAIDRNNGIIEISTSIIDIEISECASCHKNISGTYIQIKITDTGCGIKDEIRHRLFEPFFTTNITSKGTGMGLSMVHGIIHNHGGHILLESKVNKGTSIKLLLPQAHNENISTDDTKPVKQEPCPDKHISEISEEIKSGAENKHILIIDDEESITFFLSELLQQHHYKVTAFNNSVEALAYFKDNSNEINLVITDQTMPNMTGAELSEKILNISQNAKIIMITGYSEHINKQKALSLNISAYLEKPIKSQELLQIIEELIYQSYRT